MDRGKYGSKIHLVTERTGLPLSVGISGANTHDSQALIPLVRGYRRSGPGAADGDAGLASSTATRLRLRPLATMVTQSRNHTPIARKGTDSSQRLGRHRWTIERTMAWLAGCRRLHRRYERKASQFLAFTSIACTLICYRRLAQTDDF
ncbi:transposase [Streptomyces paradoxus]|uniref:transposase n=1 Tax=Streptomyces paradoxus TaxID=66375 RepID=UPI0036FCB3FC